MIVYRDPSQISVSNPISRRTMATLIESPRVAFVSGSSLPASSPFSLSRLILPFLCVSLGVSVGTATGLMLALVNAPNSALAASGDSAQAIPTNIAPATNPAVNDSPAPVVHPTVVAPPNASPSQPVADAGLLASKAADLRLSTASHAVKAQASSAAQIAFSKTPEAVKPATLRLAGKEWHVARPMSIRVSAPVRHRMASALLAAPTALDPTLSSLDNVAKPVIRYTEGDLTVADYDATAGTVESSDGRTFILGTTVATSNATSWETYRSNVHYRCDQSGSCVLMRAGAVVPNARLI